MGMKKPVKQNKVCICIIPHYDPLAFLKTELSCCSPLLLPGAVDNCGDCAGLTSRRRQYSNLNYGTVSLNESQNLLFI